MTRVVPSVASMTVSDIFHSDHTKNCHSKIVKRMHTLATQSTSIFTHAYIVYEKEIYNEKLFHSFSHFRLISSDFWKFPHHIAGICTKPVPICVVCSVGIHCVIFCYVLKLRYCAISLKGCVTKDSILTSCNYITEAPSITGRFTTIVYKMYVQHTWLYINIYTKITYIYFPFFPSLSY